ncbi:MULTISPECIES: DUF7619 domain-containing protein [Flavobacterium]|uniref:DUF7619 domain-containing protein n=1 Tax=Flavobacterium TaxID=237 RepID=UPI001FCBAB7B|nr:MULTISPECIES: T9SS type A sorting domain-containing protein [Flavobacterium]UOK41853.1 T9SS type A sorting domain-containing protein [Flavobacterium enshiense]
MKKLCFLFTVFLLFGKVNAQTIIFGDVNLKNRILWNSVCKDINGATFTVDVNNDLEIQVSEALNVYQINLDSWSNTDLTSLSGIEYFTNLTVLRCESNSLNSINVSSLTNLRILYCAHNLISSFDLTGLTRLEEFSSFGNPVTSVTLNGLNSIKKLRFDNNDLTNLDLSNINHQTLLELWVPNNMLTTLDVSGFPNLTHLHCNDNQLTSLNIQNTNNLVRIYCHNNSLPEIDFNGKTSLTDLWCYNNLFVDLDFSQLISLDDFNCSNNHLLTLITKNGHIENTTIANFSGNRFLRYLCVDEGQTYQYQQLLNQYGYSNCNLNSYCSFTPGGNYNIIQGDNIYNLNTNCDSSNPKVPNLRYAINTNGSNEGLTANTSGHFVIPVVDGTTTITPIFEEPSYFTCNPTSVSLDFPSQTSPYNTNFCITSNGSHPDLEIVILPTCPARPGFLVTHKIIFKNKGNTLESGVVTLNFNDAVLDLISSIPAYTSHTTNVVTWNYSNLAPFETREISLSFNLNSPQSNPPVNNGNILYYTASVSLQNSDERPNDNSWSYAQTVVGSFDPNDKRCLEGTTIPVSKVGDFVHYMIRFENTGTYQAENIVVKDMIDTNKFDINSIVPIKGSHNYNTRINGNKVEFIFENINLPFDDANNDGFVAFKIKTKPTLVNGNTFSNSASIYFDYNFPIVTNTATTTIQTLSTQDFSFATYFMLYPNPVNNVLNIETKQTIEVSSINIYNQLGQLVLVVPNAQNVSKVDVSSLSSGNYFIKINSDKGTSNTKFIKQ